MAFEPVLICHMLSLSYASQSENVKCFAITFAALIGLRPVGCLPQTNLESS